MTRKAEPITKVTSRGKTRYKVVVDTGTTEDGRRKRVAKTVDTIREARALVAQVKTEVRAGSFTPNAKVTVAEHMAAWLAGKRDVREVTLSGYREWSKPVISELGCLPLQQLTKARIDKFVDDLLDHGRKDGRPCSPSTVKHILTVLRMACKDAKRQGIISRDPSEFVEVPKPACADFNVWTQDEATLFLKTARADRLYAAWLLSLCGLRRSEVLGLRWSDISLSEGTISIRQSRVLVNGHETSTNAPKTTRSRRTLPIPAALVTALRDFRDVRQDETRFLGAAWKADSLVVAEADGSPVAPRTYSDRFARLADIAGVPPIPLRNVRHTSVSLQLDSGTPVTTVAAWHGHDASMTASVYARTFDESLKAAGSTVFRAL